MYFLNHHHHHHHHHLLLLLFLIIIMATVLIWHSIPDISHIIETTIRCP